MGTALLAGALGALVLLLAVPVEASFRLGGLEPCRGRIAFRWLFGLVRFRVRVPGAGERAPEPQAGKPARPAKRRRRRNVLAVLRQAAFRRRVRRLAGDLLRAVRLRRLWLRMRLGLGDPADTGRLWAVVGPLGAAAQGLRGAEVRIEPAFVDAVVEIEARGRLLVVPLRLLVPAAAFALAPASIRAWRTLRGHA